MIEGEGPDFPLPFLLNGGKKNMAKVTQITSKETQLRAVIDDGTREVPIVNKFGRLVCKVYFRPADISIIDRYNSLIKDFDKIVKPLEDLDIKNDGTATFEKDWEVLKKVELELKRKIDELFDMEEADEIFAKRNPFSSVGGHFFAEVVLNALGEVISQAIDEEAKLSKQRTDKYLSDLEPESPEVNADAGDATANS